MSALTNHPKEDVALHELCKNCLDFIKSWEILDAVDKGRKDFKETWPALFLCDVAHLREASPQCHFCSLVLATLEGFLSDRVVPAWKEDIQNLNDVEIYLRAHRDEKACYVDAICEFESPMDESLEKEKCFGILCIRAYDQSNMASGFHEHFSAKSVPLQARDDLDRAGEWIKSCLKHHDQCHKFNEETVNSSQRPTRVIEITGTSAKLRCDMRNESFEYLVLSHKWGNKHTPLQLLRSNLEDFKREIPWSKLMATVAFREAVRITSSLGYRYLWIDSLCIVQDRSDWQQEAPRMAIVYGNAICNISYLFSSDTSTEPEERGDPRALNPCILRPMTATSPGVYIEHPKDDRYWLDQHNWPLFQRAWTFQEYLLSPRTLLVGGKNLMFQCSKLFYDELLGPIGDGHGQIIDTKKAQLGQDFGKSKYFPASIKAVSGTSSLSNAAVLSFMIDWWKIVNEYRARNLTVVKDRVMAFAGIARAYNRLGNLTYLAGLWKECLPLCLLWCVDRKEAAAAHLENGIRPGAMISYNVEIREPVENPAPTWSWFSIPILAFHQPTFILLKDDIMAENELSLRRKANRDPSSLCFDDIFWASTPSFQFGEQPDNSFIESGFSDFANLTITLRARILEVSKKWPDDLSKHFGAIQASKMCVEDQKFECVPSFKYYPDIIGSHTSPLEGGVFALVMENQFVRPAGKYRIQRRFAGLLLVGGEKEDTWQRIGAWKLKLCICNVDVSSENLKDVSRRWKGYQFVSKSWRDEMLVLV